MASKQSLVMMTGPGGQAFFYLSTPRETASPHSVCSSGGLAARPAAPGRIGGAHDPKLPPRKHTDQRHDRSEPNPRILDLGPLRGFVDSITPGYGAWAQNVLRSGRSVVFLKICIGMFEVGRPPGVSRRKVTF